ncbi:6-phosphogluconolactonase [Rhodococcus aerolatus]
MSRHEVVVHPDTDTLAAAIAARLVVAIIDAQSHRGEATVALTGGGVGTALLRSVRESPASVAVDWSRVNVVWGDERFVPADDPERNEGQAREALLDHVDVDPARVHPIPASDGPFGDDVDAAATDYARTAPVAGIDVLMLGMGPEGHVGSVFPDSPAVHSAEAGVVAVRDCPKPPPTRITLTLPMIRTAREVWLCVAGEGKAEAVAAAVGGASEVDWPAAGARGAERTLWLVDREAASRLP